MNNKIKLNLFSLKTQKDLEEVYLFFKKNTQKWFDQKSKPKEEFFEIKPCPLCFKDKSEQVYLIDGFSYHRCTHCHSIYTKPQLRNGVLDALYSEGMYKVYQDNFLKKGKEIRKGTLEQRKFNQVSSFVNKNNPKILDIGCGAATFLDVCKLNGWNVEGVDPSPSASKSAQENYQIHVHQGDFNKIVFNKFFDVITLWGVLEHLSDPIKAINKARDLLSEDGLLIFEVPSADCFLSEYLRKYNFPATRYIESGRHNIFFSRRVINEIADEFDFEIEFIESNGLDIQTILFKEFDDKTTESIINIQDTLNDLLLGDHYRVFLKKK